MTSIAIDIWNCKCRCVSKQSHRSRWAFITRYKYQSKLINSNLNFINDETTTNGLINKLCLKRTNQNFESEQIINVKRVRYDETTKKIIIETNEIKKTNKKINKLVLSKIVIENGLLDLRELIGL